MECGMRVQHHQNHRVQALVCALLAALYVLGSGVIAAQAQKNVKAQLDQKVAEAMEYFDLLEYEEARKQLNVALGMAKKANLENDKATAQIHLRLGIVYFSGLEDEESAKLSFINAVEIDSTVQIDPAYKTGTMEQLLESARAEFGKKSGGSGGSGADVDCASVEGIKHTLVDTADGGKDKDIGVAIGKDLKAAKVSLFYRSRGETEFTEVKMSSGGDCRQSGTIPADAMAGEILHYYIAAYNGAGKVIASKGSAGSPNIIEISGSSASTFNDDENPLSSGGSSTKSSGGSTKASTSAGITSGVPAGPKRSKVFFSFALGTGGGYVSGETEQAKNPVGCCFAPALLHVFPELGYYLSPTASVSFAFRMGFPIGANRPGRATGAPAALLRYRRSLNPSGEGLMVSGAIGGGLIRHTVTLTEAAPNEDTDTTASGPLLVGGGVGFSRSVGGPIKFIAELNAIAGIPIVGEIGTCPSTTGGCVEPNFALQFDANVGLVFSF